MEENILTAFIVVFGSATVALSCWAAAIFVENYNALRKHTSKRLNWALSAQLVGEAILGIGTLVFAVGAHFGWLDFWSIKTQSAIRLAMFLITATTTFHLVQTMQDIKHKMDDVGY